MGVWGLAPMIFVYPLSAISRFSAGPFVVKDMIFAESLGRMLIVGG